MASPIVVMGVSGSGKSTVAEGLARDLHGEYLDADDFHTAANKRKMSAGTPLDDADRQPWLRAVGRAMAEHRDAAADGGPVVMACSALKHEYRDLLRESVPDAVFVCLVGPRDLLERRLHARHGHFMPASLLDSQLQTLEPLGPDERGGTVDIGGSPDDEVARAEGVVRDADGIG